MTRVQAVEQEVKKPDKAGLTAFRMWFLKYDAAIWDEQIQKDVHSGKLETVAREALKAHQAGKTKLL